MNPNPRYVFSASMEEDEDGGWSAWLNEIPRCRTRGDTEQDAFYELKKAALVVVLDLQQKGEEIPTYDEPQYPLIVIEP